jgi:hypothetical protein
MTAAHVEHLREHGYAIIRGFLTTTEIAAVKRATDAVMAEGLKHHASYRDRNLLFEVLNDPAARRRVLLQAHWFAWINPHLEALRRHPRYLEIMEPLLGRDIKQVTNQLRRLRPPLPTRSAAVRPGNLPFLAERLCPLSAHTHSRLHSFGGNFGGNS